MGRRAILIVLDGLGIGEMPDVHELRPQDRGANTLVHLFERVPALRLPVLESLGLGNLVRVPSLRPYGQSALASYGRCWLAHDGADTYAGHNEIAGSRPQKPLRMLFQEVSERVRSALRNGGFRVTQALEGGPALVVEDAILIGDNLEADPGAIFNVTAALDRVSFEITLKVARVVREQVPVSRVIALGSPHITMNDILREVQTNRLGQTGVVTPNLKIYDQDYQVCHLGHGVDPTHQAPHLTAEAGLPVTLIGKMADVVQCHGAHSLPCIPTSEVLRYVLEELDRIPIGLIAATVQETDLAGHEESPERFGEVLRTADTLIGQVLSRLTSEDLLILTADHGNDPTIGHRNHTREMTPILAFCKGRPAKDLGLRRTLADTGATIADHLGAGRTEAGESYLATLEEMSFGRPTCA